MVQTKKGTEKKKPDFVIKKKTGSLTSYKITPKDKSGRLGKNDYGFEIVEPTEGGVFYISSKITRSESGRVTKKYPIKTHLEILDVAKRFPAIDPALIKITSNTPYRKSSNINLGGGIVKSRKSGRRHLSLY